MKSAEKSRNLSLKRFIFKATLRLVIILVLPYLAHILKSKEEVFVRDIRNEAEHVLESYVKGQAGQVKQLWEVGLPKNILSNYFPLWVKGDQTYMVPPTISIQTLSNSSEAILHDLLNKFGKSKKIGMVVIQKARTQIPTRSIEYCTESFSSSSTSGFKFEEVEHVSIQESDFTVFYHSHGVMNIEINEKDEVNNEGFSEAVAHLDESQNLIDRFFKPNLIRHWKVIAMPSVQRSNFNPIDFIALQENENIEFLFADDLNNVNSLEKWWWRTFENHDTAFMKNQYDLALSYTTLLRHLTPAVKSNYKGEVISSLHSYVHYHSEGNKRNFSNNFPHVMRWWTQLDKADTILDFQEEFADTWINSIVAGLQGNYHRTALKSLNRYFGDYPFILGSEPSVLDKILATLISDKYLLPLKQVAKFYKSMSKMHHKLTDKNMIHTEKYDSRNKLNQIELKLSKSSFLNGDKITNDDVELFEELSCTFNVVDSFVPILLTSEQLVVYEGPLKQVIIGAPGSGKTELLKAKARELALKIMMCSEQFKVLYIVATGSPSGDPLLSYQMKKYFVNYPPVEVLSVILEEETKELDYFVNLLRGKMTEKTTDGKLKYSHVFLDEYWIGCKPKEHEVIVEMVYNIPGYVWISSVFDYNKELMLTKEKMIIRTGPLIKALDKVKGKVSYLHQVVRSSNNIIELERNYSYLYRNRSYPYGPDKILSSHIKGLPVTWMKVSTVMDMYSQCVNIVSLAIGTKKNDDKKILTLNAANILVVDFAVRSIMAQNAPVTLEEQLNKTGIPVWSFGDSMSDFMDCRMKKITLLSSRTRTESTYLDGVEWPMVVVILPSGVLLNKDIIAEGAESLRNYDTYISFFRAQLKLVVISDKWITSEEFLDDIKLKLK